MELGDIARPYMEVLSRESNKTVNLAILDKDEMVYIERIRVPSIRAFNVGVGNRIPLLEHRRRESFTSPSLKRKRWRHC